MPFLITDSAVPLLMETVPALKIAHFNGMPRRDNVYAYLRCYICCGALHLAVTAFDGQPPDTVRFGLAFTQADDTEKYLFFSFAPSGGNSLTLRSVAQGDVCQTFDAPPSQIVTGGDEQGLYWSAESVLPAQVFKAAFGKAPAAGHVYAGNVFLYDTTEAAFGAAFAVPQGETVPTAKGFDVFTIVPY